MIDRARIAAAIAEAERATSGEIVVSVAPLFFGSVDRAAERAFDRLGVGRTRHRNGVLLFVVPSRRQVVVLGDAGIHAAAGAAGLWEAVITAVTARMADGDPTGGLVAGIEAIGRALADHFPPEDPGDPDAAGNELPDAPDLPES